MTVYHDMPFFTSGDLDYIEKACDWTDEYLDSVGRSEWKEEMRLMISNHHKVRAYTGPYANLVEACRKADWIDVSFTKLTYGIDRRLVKEVRATFPMNEAYKSIAMPGIGAAGASELVRPSWCVRAGASEQQMRPRRCVRSDASARTDRGGPYGVGAMSQGACGSGAPVSRKLLRLLSTAGHPWEMAARSSGSVTSM
jgi:hypothetical protein